MDAFMKCRNLLKMYESYIFDKLFKCSAEMKKEDSYTDEYRKWFSLYFDRLREFYKIHDEIKSFLESEGFAISPTDNEYEILLTFEKYNRFYILSNDFLYTENLNPSTISEMKIDCEMYKNNFNVDFCKCYYFNLGKFDKILKLLADKSNEKIEILLKILRDEEKFLKASGNLDKAFWINHFRFENFYLFMKKYKSFRKNFIKEYDLISSEDIEKIFHQGIFSYYNFIQYFNKIESWVLENEEHKGSRA
ncbi:070R [Cherax quadricarinatus iridovirus]|nr:070R [Cherax quadricarinatus iridovirus]ASZ85050.1 070R [Cherax quadricarinatus iridovirus]UPA43656.1 070R [Iridovirus CN01]